MEMTFHKVHCPRCGRVMMANELAFDFGEIINIALEKAKNRTFGSTEEWYEFGNALEELESIYGNNSY